MNLRPQDLLRRVRGLPVPLHDLAEHLRHLSSRVRESVSDATGETVGRVLKDLLNRAWSGQRIPEPAAEEHPQFDPDGWPDEAEPWPVEGWQAHRQFCPDDAPSLQECRSIRPELGLAGLALHVAGWWLRKRGSWLGAMGLGLFVGGFALLGGRVALRTLSLFETASEVFALDQLLRLGGTVLQDV